MIDLDSTDLRILDALQQDAGISNQELADKVALSPSPCLRRVRQLEAAGVILRRVALLDPKSLDLGLLAYVNVKLDKRQRDDRGVYAPESFRAAVLAWPEVVACYAMTGDIDYLLRVQARDLDGFSRFVLDHLLRHPAVIDVRSSFALDRIKETTALPLPRH